MIFIDIKLKLVILTLTKWIIIEINKLMESNHLPKNKTKNRWYNYRAMNKRAKIVRDKYFNNYLIMHSSSPSMDVNQIYCSCDCDVFDWKFQDYMFRNQVEDRADYNLLNHNSASFQNLSKNSDTRLVKIRKL